MSEQLEFSFSKIFRGSLNHLYSVSEEHGYMKNLKGCWNYCKNYGITHIEIFSSLDENKIIRYEVEKSCTQIHMGFKRLGVFNV